MRILDFTDGFESSVQPTSVSFPASNVSVTPSGNLSSVTSQAALVELQGDIDTLNAKLGAPSGIPLMGSDSKILATYLPAISLVDVNVVADIAARNALTVQSGDVAIVTDAGGGITKTYIYSGSVWIEMVVDLSTAIQKATLTTKGDLLGASGAGTPVRVPVGTDGQILTADSASTPGVKWTTPSTVVVPSRSYEISNLGLATSVSGNALTIAVKQADGSTNPSTGNASVLVGMRSSSLTSGLYNQRSITSALSLVVSSGSTLGQIDNKPANIYVYLIDNAGTLELAVSGTRYAEVGVISTTAETGGGAGSADSNTVVYSNVARSNVPYRLIGVITNTQTNAGVWQSAGSVLAVGNYGTLKTTNVPTVQILTSGSGTYYTPAGVAYIRVRMLGAGGGGSGSDTSGGNNGTAGGNSTFGNLTAGGGGGGQWNSTGGSGGSPTVGAGWIDAGSMYGNGGGPPAFGFASNNAFPGAFGGAGALGGGASTTGYNANGAAGRTNSGSGGQGGGTNAVNNAIAGSGGGSGAYVQAIANSPAMSYSYSVGAGGAGGAGGATAKSGGAGADGIIIIEEYPY